MPLFSYGGKIVKIGGGGYAYSSVAVGGQIGATADAGETDDPVTNASAYSSGTTYARGAIVTNAGSYYMSLNDGNVGNTPPNATYWFALTFFYYFDSASGNDSNTGSATPATAQAAPLQTLDKWFNLIKSGGAAIAGSMALFKRGQTFNGCVYTEKACVMGAWSSGARPILQYTDHQSGGYGNTMGLHAQTLCRNLGISAQNVVEYDFTPISGTIVQGDVVTDGTYNATVLVTPGATGRIQVIHTPGQHFTVTTTITSGAKSGSITYMSLIGCFESRSADHQIVNCNIYNTFSNGVTLGSNGTPNSSDRTLIFNCFVHDCCVWGAAGAGIDGGWGTGIVIKQNTLYDNGRNGVFAHNIYLDDLDNYEVSYNECYMTANNGSFGIINHGVCSNGNIHHNYVHECGNGVGVVDGAYGTTESFTNINTYANKIINCGTLSGMTVGLAFQIGSNVNCSYYDNLIYGNKAEINIQDMVHAGANTNTSNLKFYNNTIDSSVCTNTYAILIAGANTTGLDIRNNVLYSTISGANLGMIVKTGTPNAQIALAYNDFYCPNEANPFRWDATDYTLATLQAAAFGGLSGTGNIGNNCVSGDPKFITNGSNYHLQGGSPAKNTGLSGLGITNDFDGNAFASPPSMGAFT